jgi:tetratricopeptide (TPR) repeat protein
MTARAFLVIVLVSSSGSLVSGSAQVGTFGHRHSSNPVQMGDEDSEHLTAPSYATNTDRQATVSAVELTIPAKARDAMRKATDAVKKHKLGEASHFAERALFFCPKFPEALGLRAMLESQDTNSMQLAKADAENAVEYDPNYGVGYVVLGSIYNFLRQFDDATRALDRGISLRPTDWQAYYEMSIALIAKGDYAGGLHQAEQASKFDSQRYAELHLLKAYAYIGLKNRSAAAAELEALRGLDSKNRYLGGAEEALNKAFATSNSQTERP